MKNYLIKTFILVILIAAFLLAYCNKTGLKLEAATSNIIDSYSIGNTGNGYKAKLLSTAISNDEYNLSLFDSLETCCFDITLPGSDSLYSVGDSIHLTGEDYSHAVYLKSQNMLEWEIVLDEQPLDSQLVFTINTYNLVFYYQHPDTFEAHSGQWHFAEDIPGSYAVYRKGDNGVEGKAFHLYRPRAWDSNNDTVWCDLTIDTLQNQLILILPDDFINQASYPVTIDPTFGYTDCGASGLTLYDGNYSHVVNYNNPHDVSGSLTGFYICAYCISESAACTATVIVYSYDSTLADCDKIATGDRVAVTNFGTSPDDAEWTGGSISGQLTEGDNYIVSWQGSESCDYCLRVCGDYTGSWGFEKRYSYDDWGTNDDLDGYSSSSYRYSVYVEYTDDLGGDDSFLRCRKIKRGY